MHNNCFDILAQTDVNDLLAYLWVWVTLAYPGYELSNRLNYHCNS